MHVDGELTLRPVLTGHPTGGDGVGGERTRHGLTRGQVVRVAHVLAVLPLDDAHARDDGLTGLHDVHHDAIALDTRHHVVFLGRILVLALRALVTVERRRVAEAVVTVLDVVLALVPLLRREAILPLVAAVGAREVLTREDGAARVEEVHTLVAALVLRVVAGDASDDSRGHDHAFRWWCLLTSPRLP